MIQKSGEREGAQPIDEGFRAWYRSCPCCMSENYPEVKRALDEERPATAAGAVEETK